MGLGISVTASVCEKKRLQINHYFNNLESIVPNFTIVVSETENQQRIQLVPFEEDLYLDYLDDHVVFSAKTSSAGPGYHAWLISVLDHLSNELDLHWLKIDDETDYMHHHNFEVLQTRMANWLKSLANAVLERSEMGQYSNFAIAMEITCSPNAPDSFACFPLGYLERDFFENIQSKPKIENECKFFFIWWNKQQDALFYHQVALEKIWCKINWLVPQNQIEQQHLQICLSSLKMAFEMDASLNYPYTEWLEVAELMEQKETILWLKETIQEDRFDISSRKGFCRGWMNCSLADGWRLSLLGKMHFIYEDGWVYWNDEITVRASILTVNTKDGHFEENHTLLSKVAGKEVFESFSNLKNQKIAAKIRHTEIEEEKEILQYTDFIACDRNQVIILSLFYPDLKQRQTVLEICASLHNTRGDTE